VSSNPVVRAGGGGRRRRLAATIVGAALLASPAGAAAVDLTGFTYQRSDAIAYGPNAAPTEGVLPGISVSAAGTATVSSASGAYAIPLPPSGDHTVSASPPAFLPYWASFSVDHLLGLPFQIGLYPATPVGRRPGFVRGVIPFDAGGGMANIESLGLFPPTFDRIVQVVGANTIVFAEPVWVRAIDVAAGTVTMSKESCFGFSTPTREEYETRVTLARARGLQFMMLLGTGECGLAQDIRSVASDATTFWNAWFAAYRPLVIEYAEIARDLGVEYLGLGLNMGYVTRLSAERWRSLVQAIRDVGYTGRIVYFGFSIPVLDVSESDTYNTAEGQHDPAAFMALFDVIGLSLYTGVRADPGEVLSPAQTRQRIRHGIANILNHLAAAPVPVLVLVGTPSIHGGVVSDQYIEPDRNVSLVSDSKTVDVLQQADLYQALFEVVEQTPTGNGRVMGVLSWGYWYQENFHTFNGVVDGFAMHKSANIRGKPAEAVVQWWFERLGANQLPTAAPQSVSLLQGTSKTIGLEANDADGDPLVFTIVTAPAHGTLSGFDASAGLVTYTPAPGFAGSDGFSFRVNDASGDSPPAAVAITVVPSTTLTLDIGGSADGTVQVGSSGGTCPPTCSTLVALGSLVTLTAAPGPGATFARWTGGCAGQGPVCTVTVSDAQASAAVFSRVFVDTLVPGTTPVRAVHVLDLRAAVDTLRGRHGLPAFAWTDPVLTAGVTPMRFAHLTELRAALGQAYAAAGKTAPSYSSVTAQVTAIAAPHLEQLRTAVRALE
jgi:hypothetical protein